MRGTIVRSHQYGASLPPLRRMNTLPLLSCAFEARDGLRDADSTSVLLAVMNATGKRTAASPFPSQWEESSNSGDH